MISPTDLILSIPRCRYGIHGHGVNDVIPTQDAHEYRKWIQKKTKKTKQSKPLYVSQQQGTRALLPRPMKHVQELWLRVQFTMSKTHRDH